MEKAKGKKSLRMRGVFIVKAMSLSHCYFYLVLVNSGKAVKDIIALKDISYCSFPIKFKHLILSTYHDLAIIVPLEY